MNYTVKTTFLRRELKYIIDRQSAERLKELVKLKLIPDVYGISRISNLYFDTPDMMLIRQSTSHPVFKEKLRLRSYGEADSPIFAEIKRKYRSQVSKRRMTTTENDALLLIGGMRTPETQIEREIAYFSSIYAPLAPTVHISYTREAYNSESGNLRVTFDENLRYRTDDLTLCRYGGGASLLDDGLVLAEIKSDTAFPLWLTEYLSREKIYPTPYSKYGAAYRAIITNQIKGVRNYDCVSTV